MNVAEALLHGLRDYGAGEVFGIPGDFALPFFKIAEESRILPLHTLSHEPAVGFAADAAGRFRGTIGTLSDVTMPPPEDAPVLRQPVLNLAALLADGNSLRQMIVVNEVLRRPEERW